jgi:hypothetical protein
MKERESNLSFFNIEDLEELMNIRNFEGGRGEI